MLTSRHQGARGPSLVAIALTILQGCGRGPFWTPPQRACDADPQACTAEVELHRAADILFVIDNSGSMGVEQGILAANFPAFVDVLEGGQIGASYRIGLTTTDLAGLRASSCRGRLSDFLFVGLDGELIDETWAGCEASCAHEHIALQPVVGEDGSASVRPWLEKTGGQTNLPAGIDMAEALQCIGPQGIDGNGFEAPLESMLRVLEGNPHGFLRDEALLAVIFVTDEADCSMPLEHRQMIERRDPITHPLWTVPDRPSSAVCWKAGVVCEGGPDVFEDCHAENIGFDGLPTGDESGVLHPVERYIEALREIGRAKLMAGGPGEVLVAVLAGVPEDYPRGGELVYRMSLDPAFNAEYGIGPGCGWGTETVSSPPGIPPVRLREFAEAFRTDERNIFSICSDDYAVALEQIAEAIARLGARSCVPGCVADANQWVDGIQPACEVIEQVLEGGVPVRREVPECTTLADGWAFPGDADICYRALDDRSGATATSADDMSAQCEQRGGNLEIVIERPEGAVIAPGTSVSVRCELAEPPGADCFDDAE